MPPIPKELPIQETPPPDLRARSKSPGRRKFGLLLKRRAKANEMMPLADDGGAREVHEEASDGTCLTIDPPRTVRSKSHSPGRPRMGGGVGLNNHSNNNRGGGGDTNGPPRNSNLAKKFSRLMRVYDNE